MDLNGMTEEEYLNNLFEQAAADMPKEESDTVSGQSSEDEQEFVDFLDIFSASDEAAITEDSEEALADMFIGDSVAAPDNVEEPSDNKAKKEKKSLRDKMAERKAKKQETKALKSFKKKVLDNNEVKPDNEDLFQESLDSIIDELGSMNKSVADDSQDIFAQIAGTELPTESADVSEDYAELLGVVDSIVDNEKDSVQFAGDYEEITGKSKKSKKASAKKNKAEKAGFLSRFKEFLVEQAEDDPADVAIREEKEAAKAEKAAAKAEKKEANAANKLEKKEAAKAAKAEAKEKKTMERQIKKEEKRAAREASNEPRYIVTVVKVALLITLVAAFSIVLWALGDYNDRRITKKNASQYFLSGDYELAYEEIADIRPEDTDEVLYEQIRTIMYVQKQYNSYLNFYNIEMKEEALNALIKGIDKYDKYYENADRLGIIEDMNTVLAKIVKELNDTFGVSEEKARALSNIEDPVEYSIELRAILSR